MSLQYYKYFGNGVEIILIFIELTSKKNGNISMDLFEKQLVKNPYTFYESPIMFKAVLYRRLCFITCGSIYFLAACSWKSINC